MATIDLKKGGPGGAASSLSGRIFTHQIELDFNKTNRAAADELIVAAIPAGSFLLTVGHQLVTAEGAAATVDVADNAGDLQAGIDVNAVARAATAISAAKFYAADDEIKVVVNAAVAKAKVVIYIVLLDMNT